MKKTEPNGDFGIPASSNPIVIFLIGMAGCGKTTLIFRMSTDFTFYKENHYIINLDPAVCSSRYTPNIDIRDTIDYKKIMSEFSLGPNGAIITSLNLFATRFFQIKKLIGKKNPKPKYILIDTPGQIEIFTWSASGSILCESFSSHFPSIFLYLVDLAKSVHPLTFVSNILYSCSVLYKTRLPIAMVINKVDITSMDFIRDWLNDFETFDRALLKEDFFAGSFARSLALSLDNFHQKTPFLGASALSGKGTFQLLNFIKKVKIEFDVNFQRELEKNILKYFKVLEKKNLKEEKKKKKKVFSRISKEKNFHNQKEIFSLFDILEFLVYVQIEMDKIYTIKTNLYGPTM